LITLIDELRSTRVFLLRNLHPVSATFLGFLLAVPELDAAADAIEQTRRDGHVSFRGVTIGDGPDVPIDAEDFLRDHTAPRVCPLGAASQALNSWPSRAMSVVNSPKRRLLELS
jgi:hypothetical protein